MKGKKIIAGWQVFLLVSFSFAVALPKMRYNLP